MPVNKGLELLSAGVSLGSVTDSSDDDGSADLTLHAGVAANARIFHLQHLHREFSIPNSLSVPPLLTRQWTDSQYSSL